MLIMNYKKQLLGLILLAATMSVSGQQFSDTKTLRKTFTVGENATVEVTNKYGDIHITHSPGDEVTVRAEITASSNTSDKLRNMMSDVEVSMTLAGESVVVQTSFAKGITPLFESLKGLTKNLINFESKLKIDYYIECPFRTALRITNSYGDVYIGDEIPDLTLRLSNGSLDAGVVRNAGLIELTFCKANVRSIDRGKLTLSFSELRTKETGDISLSSVSSKVWIDDGRKIDIDSKRDDLSLGETAVITGISYFSDIRIAGLAEEISLSMKYGNFSCEDVHDRFSLIDIKSSYTDVDLVMSEKASYNMEVRHTNAFVSLPGIKPEPKETEISADDKIYLTTARFGGSPDRSRIRIDATRGEIRIMQQ
jgi:hypothetical protein